MKPRYDPIAIFAEHVTEAIKESGFRWRSPLDEERWTERGWNRIHAALWGVTDTAGPEAERLVMDTMGDLVRDARAAGAIVRAKA